MTYIGNIESLMTQDFLDHCINLSKKYNKGNRTQEQVLEHTICGEATEILVCNYLNLTRTPGIIVYDAVDYKNRKYEIKHTVIENEWKVNTYSYFLKNTNEIDFIVLAYLDKHSKNLYIKYISKANKFANYIYKNGSDTLFDFKKSIEDGTTLEF
jgi:hypothetical protein